MAEIKKFPDRGHKPLLTYTQLAQKLGVTPRFLRMRVKEGMSAEWGVRNERRFDPDKVVPWLEERSREMALRREQNRSE